MPPPPPECPHPVHLSSLAVPFSGVARSFIAGSSMPRMLDFMALQATDPDEKESAMQTCMALNRALIYQLFVLFSHCERERALLWEHHQRETSLLRERIQQLEAGRAGTARGQAQRASDSKPKCVKHSHLLMSNHMDAICKPRLTGTGPWEFAKSKREGGLVQDTALTVMCTNAALRAPGGPLGSPQLLHEALVRDGGLAEPLLAFPLADADGMPALLEQVCAGDGGYNALAWNSARDPMLRAEARHVHEACKRVRHAISVVFRGSSLTKNAKRAKALSVLCPARETAALVCMRRLQRPGHESFVDIGERMRSGWRVLPEDARFLTWTDRDGNLLPLEEVRRRQAARFEAVCDFATPDAPFDCAALLAVSMEQDLRKQLAEQTGACVEPRDVTTAAALEALYELAMELLCILRSQVYSLTRSLPPFPARCSWHELSTAQLHIVGTVLGPLWTFLRGEEASATAWGFATRTFRDTLDLDEPKRMEEAKKSAAAALTERPLRVAQASLDSAPGSGSGSGSESEPDSQDVPGGGRAARVGARVGGKKRPRSRTAPLLDVMG